MFIISVGCERPTDLRSYDDGIPPAVPTGLSVYYEADGEVGIEWRRNIEADLKGYNIYRKIGGADYLKIDSTSRNYYFDDSLEYNITYYYKITAADIRGRESNYSNEVSASPVNKYAPQIPRGLIINARNWESQLSINLKWNFNNESDIAAYQIYRGLEPDFTADSLTFLAATINNSFSDTSDLSFYTMYYFKLRAVDKGGLVGGTTTAVGDQILEAPELIFPQNNTSVNYFKDFRIKTINIPAEYEIIVQTNFFYGIFWRKRFLTDVINDTINVAFTPPYLEANREYYWRAVTYTVSDEMPNSVSRLFNFTVKP
jgi:hypothetical protein